MNNMNNRNNNRMQNGNGPFDPRVQAEYLARQRQRREMMRRREMMLRRKRADVLCIIIVCVIFAVIAAANLFRFDRPTESVVEKRKLAEFPKLTFSSLVSGDFTEGINLFFADTFVLRDGIVSLSKKLDSIRGYDLAVDKNGSFVVLDSGVAKDENDSSVSNALDNINLGDLGPGSSGDESEENIDPTKPRVALSKNQLTLTVGTGAVITAEMFNLDGEFKWTIADDSKVQLTFDGATAQLKGLEAGEAVLTCSAGGYSAECKIKVESITSGGVDNGDLADFMTNGLFIYGDAVYTKGWYLENYASDYARTLELYEQVFPNARVSACVIPTSAIRIDNEQIKSQLPDQEEIFDALNDIIGSKVNFVNTYGEMYANRDEYIYFKSDHHWTQRGAYYAYKAFVESVGLEAAELGDFDVKTLTDSYSGSMYEYTKDERVKEFKDTVEAFFSRKELTMTITDRSGNVETYDAAIMDWSKSYSAFLCGDNPYTVINVPENPQDRNILVIKDSYGNAFVPFLAENYGNIIVVDTRYTSMNVKETFADYDLTDVLFVNNLEAANSPAWSKMYLNAIGIEVE